MHDLDSTLMETEGEGFELEGEGGPYGEGELSAGEVLDEGEIEQIFGKVAAAIRAVA